MIMEKTSCKEAEQKFKKIFIRLAGLGEKTTCQGWSSSKRAKGTMGKARGYPSLNALLRSVSGSCDLCEDGLDGVNANGLR